MEDEMNETRKRAEMDGFLDFGRWLVTEHQPVIPMLVGIRDSDANETTRLIVMARPFDDDRDPFDEKTRVWSMMGMAARMWGADHVFFLCDAYMRRAPKDEPLPDVLPAEDPQAVEALILTYFGRGSRAEGRVKRHRGPRDGVVQPYHHTPEGPVFDPPEDLPKVGDVEGLVERTIGTSIEVPDGAIREMVEAGVVLTGISNAHDLFESMRSTGFIVAEMGPGGMQTWVDYRGE